MHKLTLLLIPLLLLSSCTIDWNDEKDAKIASLNSKIEELNGKITEQKEEMKKVKDDEIFKKQQECQKYLGKMTESDDLKDFNWVLTNRIFYSKIKNACIYQSKTMTYDRTALKLSCYLTKNAFTNEEYNKSCVWLSWVITSESLEKAEERYENIYENWRSIENFDKVIRNLESKTSNQ